MKLERVIAVRTGKTIYRDGENVVKVFDHDYSKSAILNEALNDARAEETSLNVPSLVNVGTVDDGKWAIATTFIKGKTLKQLMEENPDKESDYLELFIDLQREVFSQSSPLLVKLKDKLNDRILYGDFDADTRYELHTRLASMPSETCFLHGDFNPTNIIIQEDTGRAYIIDWSHATQGNKNADVAQTYLLFYLTGNISLADKYLNLYVAKTGTPKYQIQLWLPLVAAGQLANAKPQEEEFLRSWINIADHQ